MKTKNNRQYKNGLLEQPMSADTEFVQDTLLIFYGPILPEISDGRITAFSISVDWATEQDHSYIYGNYN